jgi:hypothetical protein
MLVTPEFAAWIVNSINPSGGPPVSRSEPEQFAEHERAVMTRTNGFTLRAGN